MWKGEKIHLKRVSISNEDRIYLCTTESVSFQKKKSVKQVFCWFE